MTPTLLAAGRLAVDVGGLSREQARELAERELRRRPYDDAEPPLLFRLLGRLLRELFELLDRAAGAAPGGRVGLAILAVLLLGAAAVVLARLGPLARERAGPALFAGVAVSTAEEHRGRAEAAAAQGRWAEAVRERLRGVVRELEARGVLDPRPGRTADEVAREAGAVVPGLADDLSAAATVFDEVWYGGRPADAASYAVVADVDRRLSSSRLAGR